MQLSPVKPHPRVQENKVLRCGALSMLATWPVRQSNMLGAKYTDHPQLYRQKGSFSGVGMALPRATLGAWIGACGMQLLFHALIDDIQCYCVP